MGLFFEVGGEVTRSRQGGVVVVHAEEEEEAVAGRRWFRADQRRVLVSAPLVEAEEDRAVRVEELAE